jgi:hypothetical protein
MNKCLTILLNVLIWDQHATPGGIFDLFICIAGGMIHQQSPMSADKSVSVAPTEDQDDAFEEEVSDTSKEVNLIETGLVPPAKRRVVG